MPIPEFTPDEQLLINSVKSPKNMASLNSYMLAYILSGIILGAFGVYYESVPMMGATIVVLCGIRIYEEWWTSKWMPLWRSVIDKYEDAVAANGMVDSR